MRGQQVNLRERIPNAMFVTLSTHFYVGARMLNYSRKDVVYTNADAQQQICVHLRLSAVPFFLINQLWCDLLTNHSA